jgi:hypothetical protein
MIVGEFDPLVILWILLVAAGIAALLILILRLVQLKRVRIVGARAYRWERGQFLTNWEKQFYRVLCRTLSDRFIVFAKVRTGELVRVPESGKKQIGADYPFENVGGEHVDFLICEARDLEPKLVIETEKEPNRNTAEAEKFKTEAFAAAGMKFIWVKKEREGSTRELVEEILSLLGVEDPANNAARFRAFVGK